MWWIFQKVLIKERDSFKKEIEMLNEKLFEKEQERNVTVVENEVILCANQLQTAIEIAC